MKYQLNQPDYPKTSGCGGPADCATKQMLHSSKVQNQINNMNGGAAETGPVVPNVVGASEQQNNLFAKVAKLSVDQQENSKYDHETGKGPIKGGKRRTKKRSKKIKKNKKKTKSRRKGGRKSRAKSLSQPRSHAQFMGTNLDYAGHFPAKQGGKTSRRTRKKGGDKKRSYDSLEQKLLEQRKKQNMGLPLDKHDEEKRVWEAQKDKENLKNMNSDNYLAPSDTPGRKAPSQRPIGADRGTVFAKRQNQLQADMDEERHHDQGNVSAHDYPESLMFGGKKRRTRKRHGKGPGCSKCIDNATLPKATAAVEQAHTKNVFKVPNRGEDPFWEQHQKLAREYPEAEARHPEFQLATPVVDKSFTHSRYRTKEINGTRLVPPPGSLRNPRKRLGGKKKTKKFKKHYMWNTKGKRYMAKTYKQHLRGVKLGHTHKKPKKSKRRTKKRGGNPNRNFMDMSSLGAALPGVTWGQPEYTNTSGINHGHWPKLTKKKGRPEYEPSQEIQAANYYNSNFPGRRGNQKWGEPTETPANSPMPGGPFIQRRGGRRTKKRGGADNGKEGKTIIPFAPKPRPRTPEATPVASSSATTAGVGNVTHAVAEVDDAQPVPEPQPAPYYAPRRRPGGLNIGLGWDLDSDSD